MPAPRLPDQSLKYRPDIDGLRAIAVLLVLLEHLRTRVTGGYVGVDIFFVISGYLISGSILSDIAAGTFTLAGFYERRIRRILPALLVMLACVFVAAYFYLLPDDLWRLGRSMVAALFSVSNLLFWFQNGYFNAPSLSKPLLHTWTLAVEEQFYFFFPLFLLAIKRWCPRRLKPAIWGTAGISLLLACLIVRPHPEAAFFFAPLRAWELLLGTIVSQRYLPAIRTATARNLATITAILLIAVPSLCYTAKTTFPGLTALPPCIGAALILAAGEHGTSLIGRILSLRPVVFVGLISYSLYLWHWPVLVLQNLGGMLLPVSSPLWKVQLTVSVVSMALAVLSWRFVETPFRKGRHRPGRRKLFLMAGTATAALATLGCVLSATHGLPSLYPERVVQLSQYSEYDVKPVWRMPGCFLGYYDGFDTFNQATCLAEDPTRKHYLLLGDSHAAELYPGLASVFPEINISQANVSACLTSESESKNQPDPAPACDQMNHFIYGDYLLHHHMDAVLIAGHWQDDDLPHIGRTVAWIKQHGMIPILFGPEYEFNQSLPRILATSTGSAHPPDLAQYLNSGRAELDRKMATLARDQWKIQYISVFEDLCSPAAAGDTAIPSAGGCPVFATQRVPIMFDAQHLTAGGATLYAQAMRNRHQLP